MARQSHTGNARRHKSPGRRQKAAARLEFVQDYIPLKEIRNGIVETTDGRYLKILEIEPINFLLRSNEEQWGIISTFASWLKISPMRLQFKSVTRKADSDKYVAGLEADIESEDVTACRELGRGTIQFIREEGSREALSRRFFLIFQYEAVRRQSDNDYGEIYAALQTVTQNAKTYFAQCGNSIVQPKDEDAFVAEILYMYFNRRSCVEDPFQSRLNRVVVDAMAAKRRVVGIDPVPKIRTSNFVAPRGLDLSHAGYIIMDGTYYTYLYIRKNGFPQQVRGGWMSSLINAGEGVDVDLHLHREIRGKTIDRVAQRIRLNRTKLRELQDTSTDYEELAGSIQAGYYIKQGLSSRNEDLFYMSVLITISAPTYEELQWRKQQMSDLMKSMDIQVGDCLFQQEAALRSTMPFLYLDPGLERKSKRNVLTSGAASTYMFTSFELSDDNGILLGLNRHNNSLCIVDPFNTKVNKNANFTICGTSGAGKTFTMQVMALRLRMRGVQCYIIAPLKGHEFKRACHKIGGTYIKLAPGSSACINVMEIRPTLTPEMELIDELDYNDIDSMLAKKIQQLMIFFSLLIPDMNNEEEQMLDEALVKTYAKFGITHDNNSIYVDQSRGEIKTMPILGDLYDCLRKQKEPQAQRIATALEIYVNGSLKVFNHQTNVELNNRIVCFDIKELGKQLKKLGMLIIQDQVWNRVTVNRGVKSTWYYIDEFHLLLKEEQTASYSVEIFKRFRKWQGIPTGITQNIKDLLASREIENILDNSDFILMLNQAAGDRQILAKQLNISPYQLSYVTNSGEGEGLLFYGTTIIPFKDKFDKSLKLYSLMTTKPEEVEQREKEGGGSLGRERTERKRESCK